jgi:hypothetical protein
LHASIANDRVFGVRANAPSTCAFVITNDRVWYDVKRDHFDLCCMMRSSTTHIALGGDGKKKNHQANKLYRL